MTSSKNNTKFLSKETILKRFHDTHGDKYDYSLFEYNGVDRKSKVICSNHGIFEITPYHHHKRKQGCAKCTKTFKLTENQVIGQLNIVHNFRYTYSNFEYINDLSKSIVTCREHGDFLIKVNNHKNGAGCRICRLDVIGFNRSKFKKLAKIKNNCAASLYVIECSNRDEMFYKVGITTDTLRKRFDSHHMPYKYKEVIVIKGDAEFIWDLEKKIHSILKISKYKPKIKFNGETECFSSLSCGVKKLLNRIKNETQLQLIA